MKDLKQKVAIITGAAQGIGADYARGLASAGVCVSVCDVIDPSGIVAEIKSAGGQAIGSVVDVTDAEAVGGLIQSTIKAFGNIHILVNNAAIFGKLSRKPLTEITSDEWDLVMKVNVRGSFECIKASLPQMRQQKYGKIINISSGTIYSGQPLLLHYVSSKGAIMAMTRSLARELGDDGIRVNCISPGFTLSEAIRNNPAYTDQITTAIASMRAIKKDQVPEDLLGALLFLSSESSDFITGQTIAVDGGMTML